MELESITHRSAVNECYALNKDELVIAIRTGYDVDHVYICYGDPFSAGIMGGNEKWSGEREEINEYQRLPYQKLWTAIVKPEFHRCKYYFELWSFGEVIYYFEDGCYTKERMEIPGRKEQCFFFPWMNPSDVNVTPDWVGDTIWYQIFPDRFCNGDSSRNLKHTKPWKCETVHLEDIYGGDLRGIRNQISYLKDLGITGIYLTPIFASDSNHKYDTTDYYCIDEAFGDEEELRLLVQEAHEAGIRIMLDAVFNHSGVKFAPWRDVLDKGQESEYFDWFFVHQYPFDVRDYSTRDGKYDSFAFHSRMPKLNTNHPAVIDYFRKLCAHWLTDWNIDGIRFDVGNEVSHTFLKELRKSLKQINPDVYLLGEIWHDSIGWLMGDEYDSVMNYPFEQTINDFFIDKKRTTWDLEYGITRCYNLYMKQTNRVLFNLLDSHDTERLIKRTGSLGKFYQQLAILFTMEGSPCIYYGTEIAMPGNVDPDCRRCMPWEEIREGKFYHEIRYMKQLVQIRKNYSACKSSEIVWFQDERNLRIVHYIKALDDGRRMHVLLNASDLIFLQGNYGDVLFSYGLDGAELKPDGTCIFLT